MGAELIPRDRVRWETRLIAACEKKPGAAKIRALTRVLEAFPWRTTYPDLACRTLSEVVRDMNQRQSFDMALAFSTAASVETYCEAHDADHCLTCPLRQTRAGLPVLERGHQLPGPLRGRISPRPGRAPSP